MPSTLQAEPPYYSTKGSHQEYGELIVDFVSELPQQVSRLLHFAELHDWTQLAVQAQQMKSLAGTYGFFELTESARRLEMAAGQAYEPRSVMGALSKLVNISGRCRPGVPN